MPLLSGTELGPYEIVSPLDAGGMGEVYRAHDTWMSDQNTAFVMLERSGKVLATTGPVRAADARLHGAQALAIQNGVALQIARDLITQKLAA
jgi:hypothetical protein